MNFRSRMLFFAAVASLIFSPPVSAQEQQLTVKDVMKRYIEALGGEKLLTRNRNLKIVHDVICTHDGKEYEQRAVTFISGFKHVLEEKDGDRYWYLDPKSKPWSNRGPIERGLPISYRHPTAWPLFVADYPAKLTIDETHPLSKDEIYLAAEPIFKKPTLQHLETSPTHFAFDRKTGLLTKMIANHMTLHFEDYRKRDGVMVPHLILTDARGAWKATYKGTLVEFQTDYKMHEDLFKVPEEIKRKARKKR